MTASRNTESSGRSPLLAVITIPPVPVDDGFTLRVTNLLRQLGKYWDITLVAPTLSEGESYPDVIDGVARLETVPMIGRMTYLPSQYDVAPLRRRVHELLEELKPAALLLWGGSEFLTFEGKELPHTVVDRIDCSTLTAWRQSLVAQSFRRQLSELSEMWTYARYERRLSRNSDRVVVVGEADARAMRRIGGRNNVAVISNGVELPGPEARFAAERAEPTVIFTGVLSYPPNVDAVRFFASEVFPLVRAQEPRAVFAVAGREPNDEVETLVRRPGVRLIANVADMRDTISQSWIAVAPMKSGSGVKNKILEAWAMAKPVVMTSLAANGLDLNPELRSLVADRPADLAHRIVELIRDNTRRKALGQAGYTLVQQNHSWEGVGQRLNQVLRSGSR